MQGKSSIVEGPGMVQQGTGFFNGPPTPDKRKMEPPPPGPDARDYFLLEHVRAFARESLEALLALASSDPTWLRTIQIFSGATIVNHREWDPALRPMVQRAFSDSRPGAFAGSPDELYLGTYYPSGQREYVPWTILVANWQRWNKWLLAAPRAMLQFDSGPAVRTWHTSFNFFSADLLERVTMDRGRLLLNALLAQANAFIDALRPGHGLAFAYGPVVQLVTLLHHALTRLWGRRRSSKAAVTWVLDALTAPGTPIAAAFAQWDLDDSDLNPALVTNLQWWLPAFYLQSGAEAQVIDRIYARNHNLPDLTLKFRLPALVRLAAGMLTRDELTPEFQTHLALVGEEHIIRVQEVTDEAQDAFLTELMRAYWEPVRTSDDWRVYREAFGFAHVFEDPLMLGQPQTGGLVRCEIPLT
jgi:hypothetical protein